MRAGLLLLLSLASAGCTDQSMTRQPHYGTNDPAPAFANGSAAQPLPEGTVSTRNTTRRALFPRRSTWRCSSAARSGSGSSALPATAMKATGTAPSCGAAFRALLPIMSRSSCRRRRSCSSTRSPTAMASCIPMARGFPARPLGYRRLHPRASAKPFGDARRGAGGRDGRSGEKRPAMSAPAPRNKRAFDLISRPGAVLLAGLLAAGLLAIGAGLASGRALRAPIADFVYGTLRRSQDVISVGRQRRGDRAGCGPFLSQRSRLRSRRVRGCDRLGDDRRIAGGGALGLLGASIALVFHGFAVSLVAVQWMLSSTPVTATRRSARRSRCSRSCSR
jgi:hypothetical protein